MMIILLYLSAAYFGLAPVIGMTFDSIYSKPSGIIITIILWPILLFLMILDGIGTIFCKTAKRFMRIFEE